MFQTIGKNEPKMHSRGGHVLLVNKVVDDIYLNQHFKPNIHIQLLGATQI